MTRFAAAHPMTVPDLAAVDPKRLAEARRQLHNAVQWQARLAQSYRAAEPCHDHLRLLWNGERRALSTQPLEGGLALELRLPALHLQFTENGKPMPHVHDMEDHSAAEVDAWILVELLHRGRDRERYSRTLPFEIASPITGDTGKYAPADYAAELEVLTAWLAGAGVILGGVAPGAPLWLWPEPMHLGVTVVPGKPASNGGNNVRIAASPGDDRTPEPHFFVAAENHGTVQSLRPDAVLTASRIAKDQLTPKAIGQFLSDAAKPVG